MVFRDLSGVVALSLLSAKEHLLDYHVGAVDLLFSLSSEMARSGRRASAEEGRVRSRGSNAAVPCIENSRILYLSLSFSFPN